MLTVVEAYNLVELSTITKIWMSIKQNSGKFSFLSELIHIYERSYFKNKKEQKFKPVRIRAFRNKSGKKTV